MACTSPRRTRSSMSRLATTPGKRLVMPRSSTAYGASSGAPPGGVPPPDGPAPPAGASVVAIGPSPRSSRPRGCGSCPLCCTDGPGSTAGSSTVPGTGPTAGPGARAPGPAAGCAVLSGREPAVDASRGRGHRDLAVDDLLPVVVDLALDVIDETAGRGEPDTVVLQVELQVGAALDVAGDEVVDEGLHGRVDPLEHRRHDHGLQGRVADRVVLVLIDADGPLVRGGGGLEYAQARATRGVEHDVGAGVVHALGDDLALGRVVEAGEVPGRRDVLDIDGDVRLHRLRTGDEAGLELLDRGDLDAAHEADVVRHGLQRH